MVVVSSSALANSNVNFCLAFSPDGSTLAILTTSFEIHLWDVSTKRERKVLTNSELSFSSVFLSDNKTLLTADRSHVTIWNVEDSQSVRRFAIDPINEFTTGFAVSPDEKLSPPLGAIRRSSCGISTPGLWLRPCEGKVGTRTNSPSRETADTSRLPEMEVPSFGMSRDS